VLTCSFMICDIADGIDMAEVACQPGMNVDSLCKVGGFFTC
jgi:hypothetical protein